MSILAVSILCVCVCICVAGAAASGSASRDVSGGESELLVMVTAVPDRARSLSWTRLAAGDMAGAVSFEAFGTKRAL